MSTLGSGFQSFSRFLHHFVFAKLATSSIRVKVYFCCKDTMDSPSQHHSFVKLRGQAGDPEAAGETAAEFTVCLYAIGSHRSIVSYVELSDRFVGKCHQVAVNVHRIV